MQKRLNHEAALCRPDADTPLEKPPEEVCAARLLVRYTSLIDFLRS